MNHVPEMQMSGHLAALRGLFLVALHHGVQLPPEAFASADEADTTIRIVDEALTEVEAAVV